MRKNIFILLLGFVACIALAVGVWFAVDLGKHRHDYGGWITDNHYHWHECKNGDCNEKLIEKAVHKDADNDGKCDICLIEHDHEFAQAVTEATCEEQGYTEHTCVCGYHYSDDYTDAFGHDFKDGICGICGSKHPHEWKTTVTIPTCTASGFSTHTCTCGVSFVDGYADPRGHDYKDGKCVRCGVEHDCDYVSAVTDPTCTEQGFTTYTCTCGASYVDDYVDPHGHDYKETVTEPTCTDKGFTTYTCNNCGNDYDDNYTDPLGHNYVDEQCTRCGHCIYTVGLAYELSNDESYYICAGIGEATVTDIVLPSKYNAKPVKEIEASAFRNSSLTSIFISENVTNIGSSAFYGSQSLGSIYLGRSVTFIERYVFGECTALKSIIVSEVNTKYYSEGNCIIEKKSKTLILGCSGSIIPNGVLSIASSAFYNCGITSITIPASVISIAGSGIFGSAFEEDNVINVNVEKDNAKYYSQGNCIIEKESKSVIYGCKTSVIPDDGSVTSIGDSAFCGNDGLTDIIIPYGISSVGGHAFQGCDRLGSVVLPDSVVSIGSYAFCNSGLTSIVISNGITVIPDMAFGGCRYLRNITIPDSVEVIEAYAFDSGVFTSINIPANVVSISPKAFASCDRLMSITVDVENDKYYSLNNCVIERESKTLVLGCNSSVIPDDGSVITIGNSAFYGSGIKSIMIPECITAIEEGAFCGCDNLITVTIPNGITAITESAFRYCQSLNRITIPESVTFIGNYAFFGCGRLALITFNGTKEQWELIEKESDWDNAGNYIIRCTDGDIKKQ